MRNTSNPVLRSSPAPLSRKPEAALETEVEAEPEAMPAAEAPQPKQRRRRKVAT